MYPLSSNPAIEIQELSCVPNTPNTIASCIGALVWRRDGKIVIVTMPEKSLMFTTRFYPCRLCWASDRKGLQDSSKFPLSEQPKVYRIHGRKRLKVSLSSNPVIKIQEVFCIPNTPNTIFSCIGALVRRRDGKRQVIWMVETSVSILK